MSHEIDSAVLPTSPLKLLAISGSLRQRSLNSVIVEAAVALAPPGVRLDVYRGLGDLPHFNPDLDGPEAPATVQDLRRQMAAADGLILSCPEYAHGVPGVLKNGLDWLVSGIEIVAMPVAILNGSPHATHAVASLAETLSTMSASVVPEACRSIAMAGRPLTPDELLADPTLVAVLRAALETLCHATALSRAAGRRLVPRL